MCVKREFRIVYQRQNKVQKIVKYATKTRAEKKRDTLLTDPAMLYVRFQQRTVSEWSAVTG